MLNHVERILYDRRPITADVFLTNYCNNKCPYCTYKRWNLESGKRSMTIAEFVKYVERMLLLGVKGIILTGGGEPTVNPDFQSIADWLTEQGIHWGINTNFNNLYYVKPDYLKVSLDGWAEESYKHSRGVSKYKEVRGNIQKYCKWKKENSPQTSVGIQMVAENADDISSFYYANCDLDVDYIVIRPVESTCGEYYADINHRSRVPEILAQIAYLQKQDSRVKSNFKWQLLDSFQDDCIGQWAQLAVNEKGEVMYCCHKPYQIVGHIMDEDILDKKMQAINDMEMCDVPCRLTAPNNTIRSICQPQKDSWFI